MNLSDLRATFRWNEWITVLVQYVLVSLMLACLAATLASFIRLLVPSVSPVLVISLAFLAALESLYAWRAARNLIFPTPEWLGSFLAEMVVLMLFVKISLYTIRGWDALLAELPAWRADLAYFFDDLYLLVLIVVLIVWALARAFAATLWELEGDEFLLLAGRESAYSGNRREARQNLADLILFAGAPLVILTGLLRADLGFIGLRRPPFLAGFGNVLLYFLLALILLSLTQFAVLRARWSINSIPMPAGMARRWALFSAIFLTLVALVAALLPTRYSLGLLETLNYGLQILLAVFQFIVAFFIGLFALLVNLLVSLTGRPEAVPQETAPLPTPPPMDLPAPGAPVPWLEVLKSIVFWAIFLGVIFFSVRAYLRQHPELLGSLARVRGFRWLDELWRRLVAWWVSARRGVTSIVDAQVQRLRARRSAPGTVPGRWGYLNPRRLSPRQRVFFFYQALLRRGKEAGHSRAPSQTPYEYARYLEQTLQTKPEELERNSSEEAPGRDIAALTEQFMEARYTRHPITPEAAGLAQRTWERLRRALRRAFQPKSG